MVCRYIYDEKSKKDILIPECGDVANMMDINFCTCYKPTIQSIIECEFKKEIAELNKYIIQLETEISHFKKKKL